MKRKSLSPDERRGVEEDEYDLLKDSDGLLASRFLTGATPGYKGLTEYRLLSRNTKPTENEARSALCRILRSGKVPREILSYLAAIFAPDNERRSDLPFKAVLKRRNQGHSNLTRDFEIAEQVQNLRDEGKRYDDAAYEVAEKLELSEEYVKKVYGKQKEAVKAFKLSMAALKAKFDRGLRK